jgi:hypothetical protein
VLRGGDTNGTATVSYATSDGSAHSGIDYTGTSGTLTFGAGVASQTITIPIINNTLVDGTRSFSLTLSNPSSALSIASQNLNTVSIVDDESTLDNPLFYVRQHYFDFLNRQPDASGLSFWTNEIASCSTDAQCIEVKRINVSASFFLSIEFQQSGFLVERMYKAAYGDATGNSTIGGAHQLPVPIIRYAEFLGDAQKIGQDVVVLQTGWEAVLENNKQAFANEFVQRSRFTNAFPTSSTPTQFVNQLFTHTGVTPSSADLAATIAEFGAATDTSDVAARARALRRAAENSTFAQQETNRAFVLMEYFGYLRRNPNEGPDTDYSGYDFWVTKLNHFNGNFIDAEMVKAFISSIEYRRRFGP